MLVPSAAISSQLLQACGPLLPRHRTHLREPLGVLYLISYMVVLRAVCVIKKDPRLRAW